MVAYNAGFEGQCPQGLAKTFPKHAKALLSLVPTMSYKSSRLAMAAKRRWHIYQ